MRSRCNGQGRPAKGLSFISLDWHTRRDSLPLQMSAAGLEKQIQQAKAAVAEAEAAHEEAGGGNKELHSQLLLAKEKARELRVKRLIQLSAATGNMCMAHLHMQCSCSVVQRDKHSISGAAPRV